ncbi:MAG: hypothetical protein K0R53_549 [Burkholderiales bacterium]|nr:hypothetical protein [Burkholderiales bacterium]
MASPLLSVGCRPNKVQSSTCSTRASRRPALPCKRSAYSGGIFKIVIVDSRVAHPRMHYQQAPDSMSRIAQCFHPAQQSEFFGFDYDLTVHPNGEGLACQAPHPFRD